MEKELKYGVETQAITKEGINNTKSTWIVDNPQAKQNMKKAKHINANLKSNVINHAWKITHWNIYSETIYLTTYLTDDCSCQLRQQQSEQRQLMMIGVTKLCPAFAAA